MNKHTQVFVERAAPSFFKTLVVSGLILASIACYRPAIAQAAATPTPSLAAPHPQASGHPIVLGHSHLLKSEVLAQERPLHIYLPPSYEQGGTQRYPVLYLLDGGPAQDFVHIAGIAALAADWRYIRDFIVVGIESLDRYHELLHKSEVPEEQKRKPTAGGNHRFREFVARELKPWVNARYRTSGEDVLMGESVAGLFVTETFLRSPGLFDGYIAISPSLWWSRESLSREADALMQKTEFARQRIFLTMGNEGGEMQTGVERLAATLKARAPASLSWTYRLMPMEEHATIYHPAALAAVRWMFRATPAAGH